MNIQWKTWYYLDCTITDLYLIQKLYKYITICFAQGLGFQPISIIQGLKKPFMIKSVHWLYYLGCWPLQWWWYQPQYWWIVPSHTALYLLVKITKILKIDNPTHKINIYMNIRNKKEKITIYRGMTLECIRLLYIVIFSFLFLMFI